MKVEYLKSQIRELDIQISQNRKLLTTDLAEGKNVINSLLEKESEEFNTLVNEEISRLELEKSLIQKQIDEIIEKTRPSNLKNLKGDCIVEVRAGTGGDEAGLFANDLYMMYMKYAAKRGWQTSEIYKSSGGLGNIKEVSFEIKSPSSNNTPFENLKNESGVHRVQRVPTTESAGRIHTSTVTVAVLPILKEVEIDIKPEDIKIDTYRAGGAGGQHVNTTDSAIRITHLPTNLVVTCQDVRSQLKNREKAMTVLKSRLFDLMYQQQKDKVDDLRSEQVGLGERAEKIRTYNFPQDRITDHRIQENFHNIPKVLAGEIDEILEATKVL